MKKLIFLILICAVPFLANAQTLENFTAEMTVSAGADTSYVKVARSLYLWSFEFNASNLTGLDTLYAYATSNLDSLENALMFIDQDKDGLNDNPWTIPLASGDNFMLWGMAFPSYFILFRLAKGTSSPGEKVYIDGVEVD